MHDDYAPLKETPLGSLHRRLSARMIPFAGYAMPLHYPTGILAEHRHTRNAAGLFDVSHMGQGRLDGPRKSNETATFQTVAAAFERLVPSDIAALRPWQIRYTVFTNRAGGILDDLMVTHNGDHLFVIVNAATHTTDFAYMRTILGDEIHLTELTNRALLALQGPQAARVMERLVPDVPFGTSGTMPFMNAMPLSIAGLVCQISRSGYTGEDGFELSVAADQAVVLAERLLAEPEVWPVGLGARDSLRLEAGLCLYGADINPVTSPVQAGLAWVISRRRRVEANFPGAEIILAELATGPKRARVGLVIQDRVPARAHAAITDSAGCPIGVVTSGGFSPTLDRPIAMGYVAANYAKLGTPVRVIVRAVPREAEVVAMPFIPHRHHKR